MPNVSGPLSHSGITQSVQANRGIWVSDYDEYDAFQAIAVRMAIAIGGLCEPEDTLGF